MIRLTLVPYLFSASRHGALGAAVILGGWGDDPSTSTVPTAIPIIFESPKAAVDQPELRFPLPPVKCAKKRSSKHPSQQPSGKEKAPISQEESSERVSQKPAPPCSFSPSSL